MGSGRQLPCFPLSSSTCSRIRFVPREECPCRRSFSKRRSRLTWRASGRTVEEWYVIPYIITLCEFDFKVRRQGEIKILITGIGAPIDVTPLKDDPKLGADVSRNDNFRFDPNSQERCPFAAHIRKTNPRSDLGSTETHRILRQGISFGPEVSASEKQQKKTSSERGLLFVCYQSDISQGFEFLQSGKFSHLFWWLLL